MGRNGQRKHSVHRCVHLYRQAANPLNRWLEIGDSEAWEHHPNLLHIHLAPSPAAEDFFLSWNTWNNWLPGYEVIKG